MNKTSRPGTRMALMARIFTDLLHRTQRRPLVCGVLRAGLGLMGTRRLIFAIIYVYLRSSAVSDDREKFLNGKRRRQRGFVLTSINIGLIPI
jgi:hypothetical protein